MKLRIGDLTLRNPFVLAPLAGITDQAMRSLCYQAGASLTFTEMVSAKGLWYGDRKTSDLLAIAEEEGPVAYQLFGSEPVVLANAIYELSEVENGILGAVKDPEPRGLSGAEGTYGSGSLSGAYGIPGPPPKPWPGYPNDRRPVLFDLNAGCPVPKIVKNGEGSALLRDPDLLYDCVSAMCDAAKECGRRTGINRPVTVKMRKGFARGEDLYMESAKAIEAAGASAVTIHGRYREQYYEGKADWNCIAEVKAALKIPVIGNGDVMCGEDAIRMMEETGCDGVMIARGALGNPWIFSEAVTLQDDTAIGGSGFDAPTDEEKIEMLIRHLDLACHYKGGDIAVREMRKHVGWYIKGMHGATEIRRRVNGIDKPEELKQLLKRYMEGIAEV